MERLQNNKILEFRHGTLAAVRKIHGFDKVKMNKSVDALNEWIMKQNHFVKKDFSRIYLENTIITSKGSLERAKLRLDKVCALRTQTPQYFGDFDIKNDFKDLEGIITLAVLPKLTKDYNRVYLLKNSGKSFQPTLLLQFARNAILFFEYIKIHDYADGFIFVIDLSEASLMEISKRISPSELRHVATLLMEGYGVRVKGLHLLSNSRIINVLVWIIKQVLSAKIVSRIHVHQSVKSLHNFVSEDILPIEYGGKEKSLQILHNKWLDVLGSEEYRAYLREMTKACTNESRRQEQNN